MGHKRRKVGRKDVVIVEHHHHVLPAWCEERQAQGSPIRVVSFDYHTDTVHAFRDWIAKHYGDDGFPRPEAYPAALTQQLVSIDIADEATVDAAVGRLDYDEHIDCALHLGVVGRCYVNMGRRSADTRHPKVDILEMDPCYPGCSLPRHDNVACDRGKADRVIDSAVLEPRMARIAQDSGPLVPGSFVLDVDLDVFSTAAAIAPPCIAAFRELVRDASLITIAREPSCVQSCRLPGETIDAGYLEDKLLAIIAAV